MNRSDAYAEQISRDFRDERYFENIIPPGLDAEEDVLPDDGEGPELPDAIRIQDQEIPGQYAVDDVEDLARLVSDEENELRVQGAYDHDNWNLRLACGLTFASWKLFRDEFDALIEPQIYETNVWSRMIEAFEKLICTTACPREFAFYIVWLIRELMKIDYMRETLELLVKHPEDPGKPTERAGNA